MKDFVQPLSIYFIWHPANEEEVKPIIDHCTDLLSRDIDKPFSRSMNLPIFFRTSISSSVPSPIIITSNRTMIFVFLSDELIIDDNWVNYVENLPTSETIHIIPIALNQNVHNLQGSLKNKNQIRVKDFELKYLNEFLFISIAHEIYSWTLNESTKEIVVGKDNALKIFISHAKDGGNGVKLALALKHLIDNSKMNNFFDAYDIATAYNFEEEIINNIKDSTMVSIHSDSYSSRYWCQRELICAKEFERPIIVVDTLTDFEDRRFPFSANVPGVHVHVDGEPKKKDLLQILSITLLETIRFFYAKRLLAQYQGIGWFGEDSIICSRPPDIADINNIFHPLDDYIGRKCKKVVYPDPPLYSEELIYLSRLGIEMTTPLKEMSHTIVDLKVGISISEPSINELIDIGQSDFHLKKLSQDLARYILTNGSTLIYGGDLRENGFTEFIFNEALALQGRLRSDRIFIENHIAWPIYLKSSKEFITWASKHQTVAKMIKSSPPNDVDELIINVATYLLPACTESKFVWSQSLSKMRRGMVDHSNIRIFAGGKHVDYKGKMPGILEELFLSLKEKHPIYLLGGFGGLSSSVCKTLISGTLTPELTLEWQLDNNAGLKALYDFSKVRGLDYYDDYNQNLELLKNIDLNNGLTNEENEKLFNTHYNEEVVQLILKGMRRMKK